MAGGWDIWSHAVTLYSSDIWWGLRLGPRQMIVTATCVSPSPIQCNITFYLDILLLYQKHSLEATATIIITKQLKLE